MLHAKRTQYCFNNENVHWNWQQRHDIKNRQKKQKKNRRLSEKEKMCNSFDIKYVINTQSSSAIVSNSVVEQTVSFLLFVSSLKSNERQWRDLRRARVNLCVEQKAHKHTSPREREKRKQSISLPYPTGIIWYKQQAHAKHHFQLAT